MYWVTVSDLIVVQCWQEAAETGRGAGNGAIILLQNVKMLFKKLDLKESPSPNVDGHSVYHYQYSVDDNFRQPATYATCRTNEVITRERVANKQCITVPTVLSSISRWEWGLESHQYSEIIMVQCWFQEENASIRKWILKARRMTFINAKGRVWARQCGAHSAQFQVYNVDCKAVSQKNCF